jgi:hypothetical protein
MCTDITASLHWAQSQRTLLWIWYTATKDDPTKKELVEGTSSIPVFINSNELPSIACRVVQGVHTHVPLA